MKRIKAVNRLFLITVIVSLTASFLVGIVSIFINNEVVLLLINQMLLLLPSLIYILRQPEKPAQLLGIHKLKPVNIPLLILLQLLLIPLISVVNLLSMLIADNEIAGTIDTISNQVPMIVAVTCIALVPCIVEEIIFRGVIYHHGYRTVKPVQGMFLCGLLFGVMHMNINQFCYAFVLGVIFCLVLEVTNSLLATMIMHFVMNANSVVLVYALEGLNNWLMQKMPEEFRAEMEAAAAEATGSLAASDIFSALGGLLIVAVITTTLAWFVLKAIAKNCGTYEHLRTLWKRPERTTWEAEGLLEPEPPAKLITPALLIGMILCIAVMIVMQLKIQF